jgi:hypothetical protein
MKVRKITDARDQVSDLALVPRFISSSAPAGGLDERTFLD